MVVAAGFALVGCEDRMGRSDQAIQEEFNAQKQYNDEFIKNEPLEPGEGRVN
ncbi:MAG: hypothetical protein KIT11_07255 [Fimbriimonadaceae bacterium]|nr:hypothetical protein [Fimbriimonadaceae bacterium]QYK56149.1 MAG: hypothetical protein KF733_01445 [Fimbriimonadaceae bacterium]